MLRDTNGSGTAVPELVRSLGDRVQSSAKAETVFGEPVIVGERTVIPVARVDYGVGVGGAEDAAAQAGRYGLGGGAGLRAMPVGALEITGTGTRFIRFVHPLRSGLALALAALIGFAMGRRASRRSLRRIRSLNLPG
jgi:uncharacterized spore protein YtfJ